MRRLLTLLLTLVLGLGPTLEAIPAMASSLGWSASQAEASLPACCRRNGAHHCALQAASIAAGRNGNATSSEPTLSAPDFCSRMPRALATAVTPWSALVSAGLSHSSPLSGPTPRKSHPAAAIAGQKRTQPQRGPPYVAV